MKIRKLFDDRAKANCLAFTISGCLVVLFYVVLTNLPAIARTVIAFWNIMTPFVIGLVLAFLLAPFRKLIERTLLSKINLSFNNKRLISVLLCIILAILVIFVGISILAPQLIASITLFFTQFNVYLENVREFVKTINSNADPMVAQIINGGIDAIAAEVTKWMKDTSGNFIGIISTGFSVAMAIIDFLIGIVVSAYLLFDEEKCKAAFKKVVYSALSENNADSVLQIARLGKNACNNFIFGKTIDSLIIGLICYIFCIICDMPYAIMLSVIVGVTNIIPVFGPFIGAVPCLLILVMIDPLKALTFAVFIVVLQQIDGNIIGPRILGESLGLPTVWIMFAIIVGGALFGVSGMVIGVPMFSVVYTIIRDWTTQRLKEKRIVVQSK